MEPNETEKRQRLAAMALKQLAEGTWPQVMAVFAYPNPKAPRIDDAEFVRLRTLYQQANCSNMAAFVDLVRFKERERNVTMSFNLSMRRRVIPGGPQAPTAENPPHLFLCPDILVGTRFGTEGAVVWFQRFAEGIPSAVPESIQVMDKIFGEAIEVITKGSSRKTTLADMVRSALGEKDPPLSKPPTKH